MKELIVKVGGRKFFVALLNIILGMAGLFGVADTDMETIASIGMIIIPTIVYIITEGRIDAKSVANTIGEVVEVLEGDDVNDIPEV